MPTVTIHYENGYLRADPDRVIVNEAGKIRWNRGSTDFEFAELTIEDPDGEEFDTPVVSGDSIEVHDFWRHCGPFKYTVTVMVGGTRVPHDPEIQNVGATP
jgi:hypothetical protein